MTRKGKKGKGKGKEEEKDLWGSAVNDLQKVYGHNVLLRAGEARARELVCVPTGIYPLDASLGGGFGVGRIHTVYGVQSCGKSYVSLRTIATAQKSCSRCWKPKEMCSCRKKAREAEILYICSENDWEPKWVDAIGVDRDRLHFHFAEWGEMALDVSDSLIRSGKLDLVVIDSLAFLVPRKELEESVSADQVALQARMAGKGVRKMLMGLMSVQLEGERAPTLLMTNQTRVNVAIMFGSPETLPAGNAPRFAAATEVRMKASKTHFNTDLGRPDFVDCGFQVKKNKQWEASHSGEFKIMYVGGEHKPRGSVADETAIMNHAKRYEMLQKEGRGWACLGETFPKQEVFMDRLAEDPAYKYKVTSALLAIRNP